MGFPFSRLASLRRGVTRKCLKTIGKLPEESERLIILVIIGTRTEAQSFRREVGIGSSSHCLLGRVFKRSDTSASEVGKRIGSDELEIEEVGLGEGSFLMWHLSMRHRCLFSWLYGSAAIWFGKESGWHRRSYLGLQPRGDSCLLLL